MSIMTAMPQGAAVEGINPNLLDNWYFVGGGSQQGGGQFPINQRRATSYNTNGYSIDRWKVYSASSGTLTFNNAYLTLQSTGNSIFCIFQLVDILSDELAGRAATVSVLTNTRLLTQTLTNITVPSNRTKMLELSDDTTRIEWYLSAGSPPEFFIEAKAGATANIIAAKLELGDQQTLAHQENGVWVLNEIPNYEEQLLRCQTSTADSNDRYANQTVMTNQKVSNPNLLDNWYFLNPVNQRGQSSYSGANYGIDRWKGGNNYGSATVVSTGYQITGTTNFYPVNQTIENGPTLLNGKTVTLSALTASGELVYGTATVNLTSTLTYLITLNTSHDGVVMLQGSTSAVNATIRASNNATETYVAVKLELGNVQTLCHQENGVWVLNEIPKYQQELAKCQRYFIAISQMVSTPLAGIGVARNATTAILQVPLPVTMRGTTATIAKSGTIKLWHGSVTSFDNAPEVTGVSAVGVQSTGINFAVAVASGLTGGELCQMQLSSGAAIYVSAEF